MNHSQHLDFRSRYGPWALVAGASAGLGAEYATQLAVRGLNLVLIARRREMLEELGAQLAKAAPPLGIIPIKPEKVKCICNR